MFTKLMGLFLKMKSNSLLNLIKFLILGTVLTVVSTPVWAAQPHEWGYNFQDPATPVMEEIVKLHNFILYIIFGIAAFVLGLILYVCIRFNAKRNPVPSSTTHNTLIEIIWTVVPVLILVAIAIPSFKLLYYMDKVDNPELTLKVTGYQWYWGYEYVDHELSFDSVMIPDGEIKENQVRLLSTDNVVVLPVDTNIQVLLTAADVMHSWSIPAFGTKTDCITGRINETWIRINKEGTYYGQCAELCGTGHAYMPVEIKAVSKEEFKKWLSEAKAKFANNNDDGTINLAHHN